MDELIDRYRRFLRQYGLDVPISISREIEKKVIASDDEILLNDEKIPDPELEDCIAYGVRQVLLPKMEIETARLLLHPFRMSDSEDCLTGENFFLIMPYCNTVCMNVYLKELSKRYSEDVILPCCDGAAWHKSAGLELPENIVLFLIPPYTPEMNPIEQIWKEIRKRGFRNEVFATLEKVVDRLCDTICSMSSQVISSITGRDWIIELFN